MCNGAVLSRSDYPDLYGAIGDAFEGGDGTTTFALPDLRDKFVEGAGTNSPGVGTDAGLPNIYGRVGVRKSVLNGTSAMETVVGSEAFSATDASWTGFPLQALADVTSLPVDLLILDASTYSSVYSGSVSTVQPDSVFAYYLIKS